MAVSRPKTVKVIKTDNMGSEVSAPITADIRVEIDGNKLVVKEITTTEKCAENCECRIAKRQAKKAYRGRRRARKLAAKLHLENAAREANPQPGGSGEGNTQLRNGTASNKMDSRRRQAGLSNPANQGNLGNRREGAKFDSGEMEVITVESSEDETASELEEDSELLRIIHQIVRQ